MLDTVHIDCKNGLAVGEATLTAIRDYLQINAPILNGACPGPVGLQRVIIITSNESAVRVGNVILDTLALIHIQVQRVVDLSFQSLGVDL